MQYKSLNEVDLSNKTVLLRSDLNTPIENGLVTNNERILRSLPTLNFIIDAGARLVIMSHLGRPEENDIFQEEFSLLPVVNEMENLLNKKIMFYNLGEFEISFISTIFGAMSAKVNTVVDFFFGGSSKKNEQVKNK